MGKRGGVRVIYTVRLTVGERLIPATLAGLREPFEDWPMRDRLNRLEKLGYLDVIDMDRNTHLPT